MRLFWPPLQIGLYIRMPRDKNWKRRYLSYVFKISSHQLTYNLLSPCKLRFERGYYSAKYYVSFMLLVRLFWTPVPIELFIRVSRVNDWKKKILLLKWNWHWIFLVCCASGKMRQIWPFFLVLAESVPTSCSDVTLIHMPWEENWKRRHLS